MSSDIDVFVVRPKGIDPDDPTWRSQVDQLGVDVLAWTGNHAGISEVGEGEIRTVRRSDAGQSIRAEGITLAGKPVDKLLGRAA